MVTRPSAFTMTPSLKASEMSLLVGVPLGSITEAVKMAPSQGRTATPPP